MREVYNALPDDRPITSLCIVEDINKRPLNYNIVSKTYDQDIDADLYKDGIFRRVTRYLCHSKTEGYLGYVVEKLVIVSDRDTCPPGFTPIVMTMDTNQKALKKKQICYKAVSKNMAKQFITDIIVLSNSKIAPEGFTLAGEVNGMCVCYKIGTGSLQSPSSAVSPSSLPYQTTPTGPGNSSVRGRSGSNPSLYPGLERPSRPAPAPPTGAPYYTPPSYRGGAVAVQSPQHQPAADTYEASQSALYAVPFQFNKKYVDSSNSTPKDDFASITRKTPQQIENQYHYSFSLEQDVVQRPLAT